jgi:enoyl-CoA hydratase/carnithine racemase
MEVQVVFEDIAPDFSLPVFQPVDESIRITSLKEHTSEGGIRSQPHDKQQDYKSICCEIGGKGNSVCTITLNRPEKFNAINRQMAEELIDAFRRIRDVSSVGVIVLTGAGQAFCVGGDLEIFPSLSKHENSLNWLAHEGLDVQRAITNCEKVVIGKINGHCIAGGLELALACDLLYAKESAKMGTTEINMGVLPGWGGTARLPRSMPIFRAREVIFSGKKDYTAREMFEMGMLTRVFKDDEFDEQCKHIVENISSKKPIALRMGKEVMARSADGCDIETALAVERNGIQWLTYSPDIQQMMDQFRSSPGQLTQSQKTRNFQADQK